MPYSKFFTLAHAPLVGKERAAFRDDPAVFNCALKVQGDDRKSPCTVSDMLAFSGWFRGFVAQRGALAGSSSLLEGVVVPCDLPFPVLEEAVEALYSGSIELRTDNIESLLRLADAMLVAELRQKCILAAIESLEEGGPEWLTQMYTMSTSINIPSLAEPALGWLAGEALYDDDFLEPLACVLASSGGSPGDQVAALFKGLLTLGDGAVLRWPTSLLVVLLMRIDQLTDCGAAALPGRKRLRTSNSGVDIAAMLQELDFSQIQLAEWRALSLQASNCSKQTPALHGCMQLLLQHAAKRRPAASTAEACYEAARPGDFVTATLDLTTACFTSPLQDAAAPGGTLQDIEGANKLCKEGSEHAAKLELRCYDQDNKLWYVFMNVPHGKNLLDVGVQGWLTYSIFPEIEIGAFLDLVVKERAKDVVSAPGGSGSDIYGAWKIHFDEAPEVMIGIVVATIP